MCECLPAATDIESLDCFMTGSLTLSNESDEVMLNSAYILQSDSQCIKKRSADRSRQVYVEVIYGVKECFSGENQI